LLAILLILIVPFEGPLLGLSAPSSSIRSAGRKGRAGPFSEGVDIVEVSGTVRYGLVCRRHRNRRLDGKQLQRSAETRDGFASFCCRSEVYDGQQSAPRSLVSLASVVFFGSHEADVARNLINVPTDKAMLQ
jgi:hypothetical protein